MNGYAGFPDERILRSLPRVLDDGAPGEPEMPEFADRLFGACRVSVGPLVVMIFQPWRCEEEDFRSARDFAMRYSHGTPGLVLDDPDGEQDVHVHGNVEANPHHLVQGSA